MFHSLTDVLLCLITEQIGKGYIVNALFSNLKKIMRTETKLNTDVFVFDEFRWDK